MKIDKVLFSCSPSLEYGPFWNLQSRIYKECLQIEPICLLFGKKSNTDMTEQYGQVIEMETDPSLPWSVQLVWSKFDYPTREPDTTWLIGDIDLLPLKRSYFVDDLEAVPDQAYVHLNAGGISQPRLGRFDGFLTEGPERHTKDEKRRGGADLPGHYHCAKGSAFELLTKGRPFLDQIRHIVSSDRYGLGVMGDWAKEKAKSDPYWYYWCAEENYSSELIWAAIKANRIKFVPFYYNNGNNTDRINRDCFANGNYVYSESKTAAGGYVDIHCARPYSVQKEALSKILKLAWNFE
jgi:hypothetical protein